MFCILIGILFFSCRKPIIITQNPASSHALFCQINPTAFNSFYGKVLTGNNINDSFKIRTWQGIPSIGKDNNGVLYAAWYSGGKGEQVGNYVTLSVSIDTGKTWLNNMLLISPSDSVRFFDPTFINDYFGNVYLSFSRQLITKLYRENGSTWVSSISYNKQIGRIFASDPFKLTDGHMMNKPIFTNDSSSMLFPISVWLLKDSINQAPYIFKANFNTQCLDNVYKIGTVPVSNSNRNFDEHMIVQFNASSYLAFIRTHDGIYYSTSNDAITWTKAAKFTALGASTSSRFHLKKLKSGRLLLIMNNSLTRNNLTVFLSNNNGQTWPYSLLLDSRSQVSYPDMVEMENGELYIVYDYNRFSNAEIDFVRLNERDIVNGATKYLQRTIINKLK